MDFTPVEFRALTNARFLEDIHLSRAVGTFPADYFIFDAGVPDFMAVSDEQLPNPFGSKSLFSGVFKVRLEILVDLLEDCLSEDARGLVDLPVLRQDLIGSLLLYILDPEQVLFRGISGYAKFAGYFFVGTIEFVQIDDSTYICHRFHLWAHLLAYLVREAFLLEGGSKLSRRIQFRSDHILLHIRPDAGMQPLDCDQIHLSPKEIFQVK